MKIKFKERKLLEARNHGKMFLSGTGQKNFPECFRQIEEVT
jgi:hypothetical protein